MSAEITIAQYPQINWSREYLHEDGDPADTFGLVQFRIGPTGWRMNDERLLIPYATPHMADSLLVFGSPRATMFWVYSHTDKLFSLEETERINRAGSLAQDIAVASLQIQTAERVINLGQALLRTLEDIIGVQSDPEIVREAGMIENVVTSQGRLRSPDKLLAAARGLREIGVRLVVDKEPSSFSSNIEETYWPEWLIDKYSGPQSATNTA